jgi:hypothetical protein
MPGLGSRGATWSGQGSFEATVRRESRGRQRRVERRRLGYAKDVQQYPARLGTSRQGGLSLQAGPSFAELPELQPSVMDAFMYICAESLP